MTAVWLIAAAAPRGPWMLPLALAAVLLIQVGGFLAAERLFKALARRRKEKHHV